MTMILDGTLSFSVLIRVVRNSFERNVVFRPVKKLRCLDFKSSILLIRTTKTNKNTKSNFYIYNL
jgi:hypothetical protein